MDWSVVMERYGWRTEQVGNEPFGPIAAQVQQARATGMGVAKISLTAGTAQDYGAVKVSVTLSIECPQNEASINLATECAFWKVAELVNDAASHIDAPMLNVPVGGTRG